MTTEVVIRWTQNHRWSADLGQYGTVQSSPTPYGCISACQYHGLTYQLEQPNQTP